MPIVKQQSRIWPIVALLMTIVAVCLLIAVIALAVKEETSGSESSGASTSTATCGEQKAYNSNFQKLEESPNPGPFHDLTKAEIENVRQFLENSADYQIYKVGRDELTQLAFKTVIITMDLLIPPKAQVLANLDNNANQPERKARVVLRKPDAMEEVVCGPLPDVTSCSRMTSSTQRNPVQISFAPITLLDFLSIHMLTLPEVKEKIGTILEESFGASFSCEGKGAVCLDFMYNPVPSIVHGDTNKRAGWMVLAYKVETKYLRVVDMSILWTQESQALPAITAVWYAGRRYDSLDALATAYGSQGTPKVRRRAPSADSRDFATMNVRGDDLSNGPLRPPTLVEPDGKRFTVNHRQVTYLGWQFDFRLSTLTGPSVYDVRYKGERIAYELGLQEIAVFYSGNNEAQSVSNLVDSGALLGIYAKTMVPGADCPTTAVFVGSTFANMLGETPVEFPHSFCIFEQNDGIPLVRHSDYTEFKFYSGMLDSYLTLRTTLAIGNYDYIIDFMFHQNGIINTRVTSAGYIMSSYWSEESRSFGHQLADGVLGNIHHHLFHFKADIDIQGTSNRYETLDLERTSTNLPSFENKEYHQMKMTTKLKETEKKTVYKYSFNKPKYHVVHNNASRTQFGEIKAYRIHLSGMSKQLLQPGDGAEVSIPWARQQLVVTKHKDAEMGSSSIYAMWDSQNPVNDFTEFYEDDENIVDKDLVFWVTLGTHHIPHTEDLPTTSTSGTRLSFSLMPHNYFTECPSVSSRDSLRVQLWDPSYPPHGLALLTYGKADSQCMTPKDGLKAAVKDKPEEFLLTEESLGIL